MSKGTAHRRAPESAPPWWAQHNLRGTANWFLFGLVIGAVIAGVVYFSDRASDAPEEAAAIGEPVKPFELPNVATGGNVALADYVGKQEVVIVSYMGWFCPGCEELLVELQQRQEDFARRNAALFVVGSKPESRELAEQKANSYGITYPILYDANTRVTKELGLWSEHMQMPWMGYLIIDETGQVVASDLQLAEAKGAAPRNVDAILAALDEAPPPR